MPAHCQRLITVQGDAEQEAQRDSVPFCLLIHGHLKLRYWQDPLAYFCASRSDVAGPVA